MALPKLETGTRHELTLPSNGRKVQYRPFLVKEEKIILQAVNSESEDEMMQAIKNVAENCTFGSLDVDEIPFVDLEWIFLQLRIRSKGEIVEAKYKCKNKIDNSLAEPTVDDLCGHINEVSIDLEKVKVANQTKDANNIVLQETGPIGIKLKYPNKLFAQKWKSVAADSDAMFDMLVDSIECIYSEDEVFYPDDVTREDIDEFLDQLNNTQFKKINEFFDQLPRLTAEVEFKCEKCGHEKTIKLEGLKSFLV